ncbi:MAG: DUF1761 domain-containing protein [bacterium]
MEATGPVVNGWAVLIAGVLNLVLGFFWYGLLFGKAYAKMLGNVDEATKGVMIRAFVIQFIASVIFAYVLAHNLAAWKDAYGMAGAAAGAEGSFWQWFGMIATYGVISVIYERRPWKFYFINVGFYLV